MAIVTIFVVVQLLSFIGLFATPCTICQYENGSFFFFFFEDVIIIFRLLLICLGLLSSLTAMTVTIISLFTISANFS